MRDTIQTKEYFDKGVAFKQQAIDEDKDIINTLPQPEGKASAVYSLCEYSKMLCIQRYSRGDAIADMRSSVTQMAQMYWLRHQTMASINLEPRAREMWDNLTLSQLYDNLTFLALLVGLRYSAVDKLKALNWIGHAGQDGLLDRVAIQLGDDSRRVAKESKFDKVYKGLVDTIDADKDDRPKLLKTYVENWYKRMKIISWHGNHTGEAYVGYWCFEAALVAMLWKIDDSSLSSHKNYPMDLVRHYWDTEL